MGRRGREGTVSTAPSTPQAPRPSSGWTVTTSLISFGGSLLSCPSCGSSTGIGCTAGRSSSAEDAVGSTTSVAVGTITDGGLERAALLTPHPISGRRACFEAVIDAQSKRKKPCPTSQAADAERPCRRVFSRLLFCGPRWSFLSVPVGSHQTWAADEASTRAAVHISGCRRALVACRAARQRRASR